MVFCMPNVVYANLYMEHFNGICNGRNNELLKI